jgi:plastocyanin
MSKRRIRTSLILAVFLVATAIATSAAAARATKTVRASGVSWSPATARISRSDVIKWRGVSGTHTVTAYGGNWSFNKALSTGDVEDRTVRRAGTFRFRCTIHSSLANGDCSGMCGKVVVRS